MRKTVFLAFIASLFLCSCNPNKQADNKIAYVGENVDSAAIANDTTGQKSLEGSYEYAHAVAVSEKLAYDVRGYGGPPSKGQYCIIRRSGNNAPDTVVVDERMGEIENAFTADLNHNKKEEIYIVFRHPNKYTCVSITGFEFDETGKKTAIDFGKPTEYVTINLQESRDSVKFDIDSIYLSEDRLIRSGPHEKRGNTRISWYSVYKLEGLKLIPERTYGIDRNYTSNNTKTN